MMSSPSVPVNRVVQRRRDAIDAALEHAVAIMRERGVGGLTVAEVARRMGMRAPSLYKYFPSLHALYDELYRRGVQANADAVAHAVEGEPRGVERIRAGMLATVGWCMTNKTLAQLLYWRPVPGFDPSADAFAVSVHDMHAARAELAEAVRLGELHPAADSDDALLLMTVVISGLVSQQLVNEPHGEPTTGRYIRLAGDAVDMFLAHYRRNGAG